MDSGELFLDAVNNHGIWNVHSRDYSVQLKVSGQNYAKLSKNPQKTAKDAKTMRKVLKL